MSISYIHLISYQPPVVIPTVSYIDITIISGSTVFGVDMSHDM